MINFLKRNRGYFVVFGGFLVQLTLGTLYATKYLIKIMLQFMKECCKCYDERGSHIFWIYGLMFFGLGASVSLGGFIERKIGPSLTVLLGGWLMSINICLTYFTLKSHLSIVAISYGLLVGIGTGIAYGSTLRPACTWFPKNRGLVIGLVISGLTLSPSLFNNLQRAIITVPNNINATNDPGSSTYANLQRVPLSFLITGVICIIMQFIGSILIINNPNENICQNDIDDPETPDSINILRTHSKQLELYPHQLLFEFDFWILWLIFFFKDPSVMLIKVFSEDYAFKILHIKNKDAAMYMAVADCIFGSLGRIFWGYLIDRKPFKVIMIIIALVSSLFIGTLSTFQQIKDPNKVMYIYALWLAIISFTALGSLSVFPAVCANLFGMKNLISNYGMIFTASSISSFLVIIIPIYSADDQKFQTYLIAFIIGSIMSLLDAGITLLFRGKSLIVYSY